MSHYETLNDKKSASPEDIRKSYKNLVKKAHPDTGGSVEEFQALAHAFGILSDDEARSYYDATGKEKDKSPENAPLALIAHLVNTILDRPDIPTSKLIEAMQSTLKKELAKIQEAAAGIEKRISESKKALKGVKKNGKTLKVIINQRIKQLEVNLESVRLDQKVRDQALEMIGRVGFSIPEPQPDTANHFTIYIDHSATST